ncbi:putative glycoside hydrolase family 79 protein [Diaporthe ampelina]|uniref:Putative glycoside hydrolase family 79 protein n=1 Tax=Diaporthe ampelina TaxID=1214573 RepID=A0A0G2FYC0_9PEZI|nr:putative glycoside hydrolase family 79 protein [Diaporthe ampelina]
MPFLRVGANSQDRATLDLSFKVMNATFPEPTEAVPQPEAESIFTGRDFYALSGNLPEGTSLMWGLNLKSFNKSETAAQARLVAEAFQGAQSNLIKHVKLVDVEVGNEPDFYGPNTRVPGPLDSSWDLTNYSATWQQYAEVVQSAIRFDGGEDGPSLSPGACTGFVAPVWSIDGAIMAGILDGTELRSIIAQFGTRLYSAAFSPRLQFAPGQLMNKKFIRGNLTTKASEIKTAKAFGVNYSLTETNSFAKSVSGTLSDPPLAEDALLIVNEAIGKGNTSYVAELTVTNDKLAAYGIWEGNSLWRVVALNSNVRLGNRDVILEEVKNGVFDVQPSTAILLEFEW